MSLDTVRRRFATLRAELDREDLDRLGRVLRIAELSISAARMMRVLAVGHDRIYELRAPPRAFRGLRDLLVRRAGMADLAALAAVDASPQRRLARRLERGDLCYVGELDGRMLAHAWFQRGPSTFDEDVWLYPRFAVPAGAFWSYHAIALAEARSSGVFVKVFQVALRELFTDHGAERVLCRVKASSAASVLMHERTGFRNLGTLVSIGVPGARWMSWRDDSGTRSWLGRRGDGQILALPPESA